MECETCGEIDFFVECENGLLCTECNTMNDRGGDDSSMCLEKLNVLVEDEEGDFEGLEEDYVPSLSDLDENKNENQKDTI